MKNVQAFAALINFICLSLGLYIMFPLLSVDSSTYSISEFFLTNFDKLTLLLSLEFWLIFYLIQFKKKTEIKDIDLYMSIPYSFGFVLLFHYLYFNNFKIFIS